MIVCIKEVRSDQMTLYYMNLFKILCGLVEVALLRALEYRGGCEEYAVCGRDTIF